MNKNNNSIIDELQLKFIEKRIWSCNNYTVSKKKPFSQEYIPKNNDHVVETIHIPTFIRWVKYYIMTMWIK
jgi:hypothetical protein